MQSYVYKLDSDTSWEETCALGKVSAEPNLPITEDNQQRQPGVISPAILKTQERQTPECILGP